MKKLLVISPYFPPVNAADMQRVRMSLPYFTTLGWDVEVVTVDPIFADLAEDDLLLQSVPASVRIHYVKALHKSFTSKFGLGSIAIRSLWYYKQKVNSILKADKFDLIYFSTTQFPVCVLGAYWKKRFGTPYVIDMQDPWHSDYYKNRPRSEQPPKYWFAYRLNKYLEPIAIKNADGLVSVSTGYLDQLKSRYPTIRKIPSAVITFGAFAPDLQIAKDNRAEFKPLLNNEHVNVVYIGRGGKDMKKAIDPVFAAFKSMLEQDVEKFSKIRFHFIGTSYASMGKGVQTISPLARQHGIEKYVIERTDRISYYHTLVTLQQANALFIPGSDDPQYTASKIFPYLLTSNPVLAIFNKQSSAIKIMSDYGVQHVYSYEEVSPTQLSFFFKQLMDDTYDTVRYNVHSIEKYSAAKMAQAQCHLFDQVINAGS
ncbi:glycosyltransferase [Mucilaginibacter lutimaris]|uniref:Glycosyltransferase n=1 Tax=Mucilaginibacter lutimaris TaxID=931629 RepID=A0ABW2ZH08_9SPHI